MESILELLLSPLNMIFIGAMLLLFFISLYTIFKNPKKIDVLPSVIAATGIIGTFSGIFFGLLDFDTNNLEGSIPILLNGMKTAFVTSLVGLILSNILKMLKACKKNRMGKSIEDTSLERIASLMESMKSSIDSMKESQESSTAINKNSMEKLVASLVGDDETTLTTQMKMLRVDMIDAQKNAQKRLNEGLESMGNNLENLVETNKAISNEIKIGNDTLIEEFRNFAKYMAENNMKAFTEAIQGCIKDLNNQLQEQFGENFKELNKAVIKLLEWQEHYKETIEKTNINQQELYKGMEKSKELVQLIMEKTNGIVDVANRLGDKITTFDTQEKTLNNSIKVLSKTSLNALELLPNLDEYIDKSNKKTRELLTDISKTHESLNQRLEKRVALIYDNVENLMLKNTEKIDESRNDLYNLTKNTTKSIANQQQEVVNSIKNISKEIKIVTDLNLKSIDRQINGLESSVTKLENEGFTITKKISDNIQVMIDNNNTNLQNSVKNINTQLGQTLNTSLESLGNQLASVSEKFVSDYIPLTKELEKVVNIAKRM